MFVWALKRLLGAIPLLWFVASISFFMLRWVPGGPFDLEKELPASAQARLEAAYGLDQNLWDQYTQYLGKLLHGDLGLSLRYHGWSVRELIDQRIGVTCELAAYALLFALTIGILWGIAIVWRNPANRTSPLASAAVLGISLPNFVLGPLLIWVFAIQFPIFDATGWHNLSDRILPTITLGLFYAAVIARLIATSLREELRKGYVLAARAKGCAQSRIYMRHMLRNSLSSLLSYLGPVAAYMLCGSFVVETVFEIAGIGRLFVESANNRDYSMVLAIVLLYAASLIIFNLLSDIGLVLINPKRRSEALARA